ELDEEGNLRFRGRKKNVIVTPAGLNVYPEDLEAALRKQAGVRDCVVIPFEREGNAEPCGTLVLQDSKEAGPQSAVEAPNLSPARYQNMRQWRVWPELDFPRTATGKPRLGEISARAPQILQGRSGNAEGGAKTDALGGLLSKVAHTGSIAGDLERE